MLDNFPPSCNHLPSLIDQFLTRREAAYFRASREQRRHREGMRYRAAFFRVGQIPPEQPVLIRVEYPALGQVVQEEVNRILAEELPEVISYLNGKTHAEKIS